MKLASMSEPMPVFIENNADAELVRAYAEAIKRALKRNAEVTEAAA